MGEILAGDPGVSQGLGQGLRENVLFVPGMPGKVAHACVPSAWGGRGFRPV